MGASIILMGDVVSSQSCDQAYLAKELGAFRAKFSQDFQNLLIGKVVPKIGDEFQCICRDLKSCLLLIIEMDEYFLTRSPAFQSRYVVAQGTFYGDPSSPEGRLGKNLALAHQSLHQKEGERKRVSLEYTNFKFKNEYEDIFFVMDVIKSSWKPKDYQLIHRMIRGHDYKAIAEDLGKTKQQIQKRSVTLQIDGYLKLKKLLKNLAQKE